MSIFGTYLKKYCDELIEKISWDSLKDSSSSGGFHLQIYNKILSILDEKSKDLRFKIQEKLERKKEILSQNQNEITELFKKF